ncbi:uncharacterized protein LOC110021584 isoform X2 [Phalaenopsis equestris]|uniref:uncharacterized protein LOC110021584 isoform X2 n=1 Tax=Phalaenopsis equestris TaxID=78828 RepID=UPI0009E1C93A|nr:uncharacterized protein LOC110021584 isoform X2 [Phalaenopsis equestris]
MSPPSLFQSESSGRNWREKEESDMGDGEHTILEREVADIIIHLLHRQDSVSVPPIDRRSSQEIGLGFGFPRWNGKRKRSVHGSAIAPVSNAGDAVSGFSSDALISFPSCKENDEDPVSQLKARIESRESGPNLMKGGFKSEFSEYEERGLRFCPEPRSISGGREFVVPDLNMSAEDVEAAADDMRRRQEEVYVTACRRMAAADARRRRKELQRMKNSIAADAPLCSRVR